MNLKDTKLLQLLQEDLNFLLTNRVPRRALTLLIGRISRIESRWFTALCIRVWRCFTELDFSEAQQQSFGSLRACFTRALKPGSRPQDSRTDVLTSPCDAIVGAMGTVGAVGAGEMLQAKGFPYRLEELLGDSAMAYRWEGAQYVTLRLTSAMYHRFHAPHDGRLTHVRYISGDTWNVNPIALKRIERLFARNERAVLSMRLHNGMEIALVPVAAILVASIRLHALDVTMHQRWKGPNEIPCDHPFRKGDELGWFEHGSTIILIAPPSLRWAEGIVTGARIRAGVPLMQGCGEGPQL